MTPYPWWQRLNPFHHVAQRIALSRAKHPSLAGHPRIALRLAKLVPRYEYTPDEAFGVDGAPPEIVARRRQGFTQVGDRLHAMAPRTIASSASLQGAISDVDFVSAHRVPFQFRSIARALPVGSIVGETNGPLLRDLDGNWA